MKPTGKNLASMMAKRATDLVAIAIVAVGVLSISGRLAEWWSTDAEDLLDPSRTAVGVVGHSTAWGAGETPVAMRLGKLPVTVHRQLVTGDQARAWAVLHESCRQLLERNRDTLSDSLDSATEHELLEQLSRIQPTDSIPGRWRLYRVDQEEALFVGSALIGVREQVPPRSPEIACWGMAIPRDNTSWTIFLFDKARQASLLAADIPLPESATPVMSVADPSGGQVASFERLHVRDPDGVLAEWRRFFSTEFSARGWRTTRDWQPSATGWSARFDHVTEAQQTDAVELFLRSSREQRVLGVAHRIVERPPPSFAE